MQEGNLSDGRNHNVRPIFFEDINKMINSDGGIEVLRGSIHRQELSIAEVDTILSAMDNCEDCIDEEFVAELLIYREEIKQTLAN